jgi:hypothetical protein
MFQQGTSAPEGITCVGPSNCQGILGAGVPFHYQTALYQFTFGTPFLLNLSANAFAEGEPGDTHVAGLVDVSLDGIAVLDSTRNPVNYSITSQSGAIYPTPEPSSLLLLATFVTVIGGVIRKRLRSSTHIS